MADDPHARDRREIEELKARYFRYLDTKQWDAWRGVFTDDARFEGTRRPFTGPDDFVAATGAWLQQATTVHQGHMPEIVFTGEDTARGVWAMFDRVEFPSEDADWPFPGSRGFTGYGHYEEEYRREDGEWRISLLRVTRLLVTPLPGEREPRATGLLESHGTDWLAGK